MKILEHFDRIKVGELIRNVRKERGLRQEDLADENISATSISNIEKGLSNVKNELVVYLLDKLNLTFDQISKMIEDDQRKLEQTKFRLEAIQNIIDSGEPDKGLSRLKDLCIESTHPYFSFSEFLIGKCFLQKRNWNKAVVHFQEAIRLSEQDGNRSNIKSASLNELAKIAFFQKDANQALRYTDQGIEAFRPDGERQYYKYHLMKNRAGYLRELGRNAESIAQVNELWMQIDDIKVLEVKLQLYEFKSEHLKESKQYVDAIRYAKEGIELARINNIIHRTFDLWTLLGDIHLELKDFETAEFCYLSSLDLKSPNENKYWLTSTYTQLGKLYLLQKNWNLAESTLNKAIEMSKSCDDKTRVINAYIAFGDLYFLQEMLTEAVNPYQKALQLAQTHQLKNQEVEIHQKLAQCWEYVDQDQFHECLVNKYRAEIDSKKGGIA